MCRVNALFFRAAEHGISEAKGVSIEPPFGVIACDVPDTVRPEQMRVHPLPLLKWPPALGLKNRVMQVRRMGQETGFPQISYVLTLHDTFTFFDVSPAKMCIQGQDAAMILIESVIDDDQVSREHRSL